MLVAAIAPGPKAPKALQSLLRPVTDLLLRLGTVGTTFVRTRDDGTTEPVRFRTRLFLSVGFTRYSHALVPLYPDARVTGRSKTLHMQEGGYCCCTRCLVAGFYAAGCKRMVYPGAYSFLPDAHAWRARRLPVPEGGRVRPATRELAASQEAANSAQATGRVTLGVKGATE